MVKLTALKIKSLSLEDLNSLIELDQVCFDGLWTADGYIRELESPNSYFLGIFPPCSHELLGMGCFWSILEEAHITILAVHPQYQNQGLGQALLYSVLKTASEVGLERATLEVRVSNHCAISLYQKFGFQTAGKRPRYYTDNDEDALILWLSNLQHPQFNETLQVWDEMVTKRLSQSLLDLSQMEI
ncbi:MAG: ribosomal protein S18-alanine N-acetyltransferase [Sphaerospermopsis sp. SIO1G2]|nr:ribosomal protein S18-alanine N-acetyltransferase [Sphaerospermopsis sp. SIO1G1]NET70882.1 ribosomal protein S18-alanine N-acetyltransferase [Sphaerospermopsis sp. SIO1G2]